MTQSIKRIVDHPEQYAEAEEAVSLGFDLRVMLFGRKPNIFRILFAYDDSTVTIYRIRHAAQDSLTVDDI